MESRKSYFGLRLSESLTTIDSRGLDQIPIRAIMFHHDGGSRFERCNSEEIRTSSAMCLRCSIGGGSNSFSRCWGCGELKITVESKNNGSKY